MMRRFLRVLFLILTVAALLLAISPGPDEPDPGAATGGSFVFAASFGLVALFPTWRGVLLGLAAFFFGSVFLPPASGDPDPLLSSAAGFAIGAVLLTVAGWRVAARFVRRMRDKVAAA